MNESEKTFMNELDGCFDCGELIYEDELPESLTTYEYDEWFKTSYVDGVRIGVLRKDSRRRER